ncbi:unnamed protein product [Urochloa decumbens]|uniref:GRF-type domain-containing protein n=1 Tax=Urochloa decumbens TaxID=240449 RepID=A0ABC9DYC6_9POAL
MHAMGGDSSGSASDPQGGGGLPIIWCTDCGRSQVLRCVSQRPWSFGHAFYCCPFYKRDGSGCPFWHWEEEYVKIVATVGRNVGQECDVGRGAGTRNRFGRGMVAAGGGDWSMHGKDLIEGGDWNREAELVSIGKEVVRYLKAICLLCVCALFVLFLILIVQIMK